MGYVLREVGIVTVHADTCVIVCNEEKREHLKAQGKAAERRAVGVVVYSEEDFDAFYNKHCTRIANDANPFTVLVVDKVNIPTKQEVRTLMEEALQRKKTNIETDWFSQDAKIVPRIELKWFGTQRHLVRTFFQGQFQDEPRKGRFRFRDVHQIFPRQLADVLAGGHISEREYQNLQNVWKLAFSSQCEYAIVYVWVIGHTDVI